MADPVVVRPALLEFPWRLAAIVAGLLAVLTIATYAPVRHFGFVALDDPVMVTENPQVLTGLTWATVKWAFGIRVHFWMPATWLSLMADTSVFGTGPWGYHVTNVVLHTLNVLLLFGWLVWATRAIGRSGFVAAMFAVHPLHVESVAWITERKDVLSTLFWWLTILAYLWYVRSPAGAGTPLVAALFVVGLAAKPMLVTVPITLLLLDVWPLGRLRLDRVSVASAWPVVLEKLPMVAIALGAAGLAYVAEGTAVTGVHFPLGLRLENAMTSYVIYLMKTVWPSRLAVFYPYDLNLPTVLAVAAGLGLTAITIGTLFLRRTRPYLAMGWFWFVLTLMPVIGVVQVSIYRLADRFTYVPLVGVFIAVAWAAPELARRFAAARALPIVAVAAIASMVAVTRVQLESWRDTVSMWEHTAEVILERATRVPSALSLTCCSA